MQTDPRDVEPATRFLQRYLPAVEEIISKAQSLSQQLAKHGTDQKVQKQSLRILQALHSAFRQKHAQRLENDETEFNTEVSTLEKLLKTDGFLWRNAAES
ncbi:5-bromo-4-chloroindolyl phosphate hydrolysis family protein [Erwinia sp. HR93]|uniref:5-bromo-4-chloroindolyl phosphate hydrolysis family protein n=1 Tax=Erwinia sp. HR93 TaxID=3094840 RepID=UPI003A0FDDDE